MTNKNKLLQIRAQIDAIDDQLLSLMNARANCAQQVAEAKQGSEKNTDQAASDIDTAQKNVNKVVFYRPEREAQILRRMMADNSGPLHDEQISRIYREIISSCLSLEEKLKIAFLGPEGTFTQAAVYKHFGHSIDSCPCETIDLVFREVGAGNAHYGVVPIENSTEGVITHTLDSFIDSPLKICGEVHLRIHQNLMCQQDDWQSVQRVYSHQQSLAQCRKWLDSHLPKAERIAVNSNAEAVRLACEDEDAAAIGGQYAADVYGLRIAQMNIEDQANNTTRFLVIGEQSVPPSGQDKTSLLLSTRNKPGALYHLLKPLVKNDLDLTRIESRPSRSTNWEYVFFLDVIGHEAEEQLRTALTSLAEEAEHVRVLGSYPEAVL
jgi:chorismate mutase/prephenate dehydratase